MINYSPLLSRVRRIVKTYEYCIESVELLHKNGLTMMKLKKGYQFSNGYTSICTTEMEEVIQSLKRVTKPATREIKVALYGFKCPICGKTVSKGNNYADLGGLKICIYCNVQD